MFHLQLFVKDNPKMFVRFDSIRMFKKCPDDDNVLTCVLWKQGNLAV